MSDLAFRARKKALIDADLTQTDIATRVCVSRSLVQQVMQGRSGSPRVFAALVESLGAGTVAALWPKDAEGRSPGGTTAKSERSVVTPDGRTRTEGIPAVRESPASLDPSPTAPLAPSLSPS